MPPRKVQVVRVPSKGRQVEVVKKGGSLSLNERFSGLAAKAEQKQKKVVKKPVTVAVVPRKKATQRISQATAKTKAAGATVKRKAKQQETAKATRKAARATTLAKKRGTAASTATTTHTQKGSKSKNAGSKSNASEVIYGKAKSKTTMTGRGTAGRARGRGGGGRGSKGRGGRGNRSPLPTTDQLDRELNEIMGGEPIPAQDSRPAALAGILDKDLDDYVQQRLNDQMMQDE